MFARIFALAALTIAPAAWAQEPPPPTAEAIAAASATADRMITEAGAGDFFTNTSKDGAILVTHKPSGMVCRFGGGPRDRIAIFPTQDPAVPRGFDVGCTSWDEGLNIDFTLYATRYRPMPTEDQDMEMTVRSIRARWPDARPHTAELVSMSSDDQPAPKILAFDVVLDGKEKMTVALISHREDWAFKGRVTGPREPAMVISLYGSMMFQGALLERDMADD